MDFSEPPKVRALRGLVREFVEAEVLPLEAGLRHGGFAALLPALEETRNKARATGLFAAHVPEAYGGAGLSLVEFAPRRLVIRLSGPRHAADADIPIAGEDVLGLRPPMDQDLARRVEDQDIDRAVPKVVATHAPARHLREDAVTLVNDIDEFIRSDGKP